MKSVALRVQSALESSRTRVKAGVTAYCNRPFSDEVLCECRVRRSLVYCLCTVPLLYILYFWAVPYALTAYKCPVWDPMYNNKDLTAEFPAECSMRHAYTMWTHFWRGRPVLRTGGDVLNYKGADFATRKKAIGDAENKVLKADIAQMRTTLCSSFDGLPLVNRTYEWQSQDGTALVDLHLALILSQHRGGSKHLSEVLDEHPFVTSNYELASRFWFSHCSKLSTSSHCDAETLLWTVARAFQKLREMAIKSMLNPESGKNAKLRQLIAKSNEEKKDKRPLRVRHLLVFKFQLYDFNPETFALLLPYLSCASVSVLQLHRLSALSATWNAQADVFERMHSGVGVRHRKWSDRSSYVSVKSMPLEPSLTLDSVLLMESNRQYLERMATAISAIDARMNASTQLPPLKFMVSYYEELVSERYSQTYYQMIEAFLNLESGSLNPLGGKAYRQHPTFCFRKISNWNSLKARFRTSDSYYSCQKEA